MRAMRLAALLLTGIAGLIALGACDAGGTEVPEGFVKGEAPTITFAYPKGWEEIPAAERLGEAATEFLGPESPEGTPWGILVFASDEPEDGDFEGRVHLSKANYEMNFPDFELVDEQDIEIPGAEDAVLLEWTYTTDAGETARSYDVIAQDEGGHLVVFRVEGPEAVFEADVARDILDTLAFST